MCGIIAIVSNHDVVPRILAGLKKLEYRGYDSAGVAVINGNKINVIKAEGKIAKLQNAVHKNKSFQGQVGIGHTRWATHGEPSKRNAHPHSSENVSVVHNGIIENYQELKEKVKKISLNSKVKFLSQTDSEVIPHLISFYLNQHQDKKRAVLEAIQEIHGTFALAIIFKGEEDLLVIAKKGSPLIIGYGQDENFIASDCFALDGLVDQISYLEDGDVAFVTKANVTIFDLDGKELKRSIQKMEKLNGKVSKDNYDHFMLKEIFEQPRVIQDSISAYLDVENGKVNLPNFPFDLKQIEKITIVACGTSYYAGMVGKYLIESLARVNVEVDIASEFRYRNPPFNDGKNLVIFISQSGETADSIAALKFAKAQNQKTVAIVNVITSTMAHLADAKIRTVAGPEIGVASTKAYTAQLMVLILFALELGMAKGNLNKEESFRLINSLIKAPEAILEVLRDNSISQIKKISKYLTGANNILYTGRGISYITSLEGALKLKELSYINSQGIAAGELKHGTIALIDKKLPVIFIAPGNDLFDKVASNVEEVSARGGKVILISDQRGISHLSTITFKSITIPEIHDPISEALIGVVPTQLIAYYVSLYKGNDVDQPRNLAKSVTVE